MIKLQGKLKFEFDVAALRVLFFVPPKPSGNVHSAAFYVYEDEARDERIAAFIDAGEDEVPASLSTPLVV